MTYNTSELCDQFADAIDVLDPLFVNFGGRDQFSGQIHIVKCFEDNALIREELITHPGTGKVLLVDGGGSTRRALIDREIAELALDNDWEGIICYGSVRHVDELEGLDLGIQAVASIPVAAESKGGGETGLPVNFANVSFYQSDYLYADSTGIVISAENLVEQDPNDEDGLYTNQFE